MKLAVSNIAWQQEQDEQVYSRMKEMGYAGLEIAPTRIFPQNPYEDLAAAGKWAQAIREKYGFAVPSMQSIWFGRQEKLFGSEQERQALLDYTKKAIDFAQAVGCKNLVFGCPRNRVKPEDTDDRIAAEFFREIGEYAVQKGTVIGMEANPPIYNTNYINDTQAALDLICRVNSEGFKLNLDMGTMIHNGESADMLEGAVDLISHVHISEPGLRPIEKREIHEKLAELLRKGGYEGFISVEMGRQDDWQLLADTIAYTAQVFG